MHETGDGEFPELLPPSSWADKRTVLSLKRWVD